MSMNDTDHSRLLSVTDEPADLDEIDRDGHETDEPWTIPAAAGMSADPLLGCLVQLTKHLERPNIWSARARQTRWLPDCRSATPG